MFFKNEKRIIRPVVFGIANISHVEYPIGAIVFVDYVGQYHKIFWQFWFTFKLLCDIILDKTKFEIEMENIDEER